MKIFMGFGGIAAVWDDGTAEYSGLSENGQAEAVASWTNLDSLAIGSEFVVGLKKDGTCVAAGSDDYDQVTDVVLFTGVQQIVAGSDFVAALKDDGTVTYAGSSLASRLDNTSSWTGITQISAGSQHLVGLMSDGSVVGCGSDTFDQVTGAAYWSNITQLSANGDNTLGLQSDGVAVAVGHDYYSQATDVNWTNVQKVASCGSTSTALLNDGTVVSCGKQYYVDETVTSTWTDIINIYGGSSILVAEKSDGTFVASGTDYYGLVTAALAWVDTDLGGDDGGDDGSSDSGPIPDVTNLPSDPSIPSSFLVKLTGDQDGVEDIYLPAKNLTARLRSGSDSYLSVTLPYTSAIATAINARSNGDLYLYYTDATGTSEVVNVSLDSIQTSKGTSSKSIVLTGYRQVTNDGEGAHEVVANATVAGDTSTITIPGYVPEILAGDSVTYDDLSITANLITLTAQANSFSIQTVYSEGS
jgi:hypothetical protein